MSRSADNRMGWVRNIDKLREEKSRSYEAEYEIASDAYIPGLLDYQNGILLCSFMTLRKDHKGLYKYALKVKIADDEEPFSSRRATTKGYLFKGGIPGELLALFSLYFQCRLYLIAAFSGDLTRKGTKIKLEYDPVYCSPQPYFDPAYFPNGKRNFAIGLPEFLDQISQLEMQYHQKVILACYHYARALKEFGVDEEMVFIRLVSAVEALSKWSKLTRKDDLFDGKKFDEIVRSDRLSHEQREQLQKLFEVRKAKLRFKRFIEYYSKGFFKGGNCKAPHTRIKRAQLTKALDAIYDSRSEYLHHGEPMYLSLPMRGSQKWHTDPSLGRIIDNRRSKLGHDH